VKILRQQVLGSLLLASLVPVVLLLHAWHIVFR
jgi:hypothetical protein